MTKRPWLKQSIHAIPAALRHLNHFDQKRLAYFRATNSLIFWITFLYSFRLHSGQHLLVGIKKRRAGRKKAKHPFSMPPKQMPVYRNFIRQRLHFAHLINEPNVKQLKLMMWNGWWRCERAWPNCFGADNATTRLYNPSVESNQFEWQNGFCSAIRVLDSKKTPHRFSGQFEIHCDTFGFVRNVLLIYLIDSSLFFSFGKNKSYGRNWSRNKHLLNLPKLCDNRFFSFCSAPPFFSRIVTPEMRQKTRNHLNLHI